MQAGVLESVFQVFTILLFIGMLLVPFVVAKVLKRPGLLLYLMQSVMVSGIYCIFFIYWRDVLSREALLHTYGFTFRAMSDEERWANVLHQNRAILEPVYESMFGIGWPLRVFFWEVLFVGPYTVLACILINYFKQKKQSTFLNG